MDSVSSTYGSSSASTFKIGGLVSGLNTNDIVDQLMEIERKPVQLMEYKKAQVTERLTAWRDLNTRILAFQSNANSMKLESTFEARTATSSDTDILTVSASSGTNNASQTVKVLAMAKNHQMASETFTSATQEIGSGSIEIQIGSKIYDKITLDEDSNTLNKLRDTINSADYGVTANVIEVNDNEYKLTLSSNTNGAGGEVTLNLEGDTPAFSTIQNAQDAHIQLGSSDGGATPIDIYSSSNTVTGIVDGVMIDLKKVDPDTEVTISLNSNSSQMRDKIEDFLDQFNNMVDFFDSQLFYDAETEEEGALFSSTELNWIKRDLYSAVTDPIQGEGDYHSLNELGIALNDAGKLYIQDSSLLTQALESNLEGVKEFFTNESSGVGVRVDNYLDDITEPTTGLLQITEDFFSAEIESLDDRIATKNEYLVTVEENYFKKFGKLETTLAQIQSQGDQVMSQLDALVYGSSSNSSSSS